MSNCWAHIFNHSYPVSNFDPFLDKDCIMYCKEQLVQQLALGKSLTVMGYKRNFSGNVCFLVRVLLGFRLIFFFKTFLTPLIWVTIAIDVSWAEPYCSPLVCFVLSSDALSFYITYSKAGKTKLSDLLFEGTNGNCKRVCIYQSLLQRKIRWF